MTTTTTPVKTAGTSLLALTQQATAVVTVGSPVDVSGKLAARIFVKLGRTVATALGNDVLFRIEGSAKASGNDEWVPIFTWTSANGKTASSSTTLNGATTAGNTTAIVTSATGIAAGDILYFRETGTPANSEWSRVASMSGATVTFEEAQTRNHTNGINVADLGEMSTFDLDVSALARVRLVVDSASNASGQTVDVLAWITTLDSFLNT